MATRGFDKSRGTFFLSGIMIAMSFVAMVVPLGMYHVAQIGAAAGRKRALMVLATVLMGLMFLGLLSGEHLFLLSALTGIAWLPGFALGLWLRSKGGTHRLVLATVIMFVVPAATILFLLTPAQVQDFSLVFNEMNAAIHDAAKLTGSVQSAENAQNMAGLLDAFQKSSEFTALKALFESSWDGRLLWLIYGSGAPWLFGFVMMAIGNVVLLDVAFEQVERLSAVARHIDENPERFSEPLRSASTALQQSLSTDVRQQYDVTALRHPGSSGQAPAPLFSRILRKERSVSEMRVLGFQFTLSPSPTSSSWRLREQRLPLWFVLGCVGLLLVCGFLQTAVGPNGILLTATEASNSQTLAFQPLIALLALLGFLGGCVVATEGVITLLQLLSPLAALILLLVFILAGSLVAANPLLVIAILGTAGLLDHLYDLRKLNKI